MEQKQVCASHLPVGLQRFFSWSEQADVLYVRWVYSKGMDRFLSGCNEGWRCVQMCISLSPLVPCSWSQCPLTPGAEDLHQFSPQMFPKNPIFRFFLNESTHVTSMMNHLSNLSLPQMCFVPECVYKWAHSCLPSENVSRLISIYSNRLRKSQTFPLSSPPECVSVMSADHSVLWETWDENAVYLEYRDGIPFRFLRVVTPPPSVLGNVFFFLQFCAENLCVCVSVCATVWLCLLVSWVARWDGEIDESFVGLLTSPLHSNLSSCGFTMSGSTDTPWRTAKRSTLTPLYWESKRLSSLSLNCLAPLLSPLIFFLAACSLRPQLMMQAEPAVWRQEAETERVIAILPLCFGNSPVASVW